MNETAHGDPVALIVEPRCNACGESDVYVELQGPSGDGTWRFIYRGIVAGNGSGDDISRERAARIATAFAKPLTYDAVHQAEVYDDAGFCAHCGVAYCYKHWNERHGYGHCPLHHGKSLDPHWSPDWD